jgi:transcriptional regulator with XRE-family HTH domain
MKRNPHRIRSPMVNRAITEEVIRTRLRANVRSLRNAAALTLKKASERAEMHWRHWQKIEAGQVNLTVQTLVRIASVLEVDPADLLHEPKRPLEPAPQADAPRE